MSAFSYVALLLMSLNFWSVVTADNVVQTMLLENFNGNGVQGIRPWELADLPSKQFTELVASLNGQKVFIGTSDGLIYSSSDFGETWSEVFSTSFPTLTDAWSDLAVSGDGCLVGAVSSARTDVAYISNNCGATWSQASGMESNTWQDIAISSDGSTVVVVGTKILVSSDAGTTWSTAEGAGISQNWIVVAISSDGSFITSLTACGDGDYLQYDSFDRGLTGSTWNLPHNFDYTILDFKISPTGTNQLAQLSEGNYMRTGNSGQDWQSFQDWGFASGYAFASESIVISVTGQGDVGNFYFFFIEELFTTGAWTQLYQDGYGVYCPTISQLFVSYESLEYAYFITGNHDVVAKHKLVAKGNGNNNNNGYNTDDDNDSCQEGYCVAPYGNNNNECISCSEIDDQHVCRHKCDVCKHPYSRSLCYDGSYCGCMNVGLRDPLWSVIVLVAVSPLYLICYFFAKDENGHFNLRVSIGLFLYSLLPLLDMVTDLIYILTATFYNMTIFLCCCGFYLASLVTFSQYLLSKKAYPRLRMPSCIFFKSYDASYKYVVTGLAVTPFVILNAAWLLPFWCFGGFLYGTKGMAIVNVGNIWLRIWMNSDAMVAEKEYILDVELLNESLYKEMLVESLPQMIIQVYNNTMFHSWSPIGFVSTAISAASIAKGLFSFWYYKYRMHVDLGDIPVTIQFGTITLLKIADRNLLKKRINTLDKSNPVKVVPVEENHGVTEDRNEIKYVGDA